MRFRHDIENEDGDVIDNVTVEAHFSPYVPAFTSGAPEDCYPAEGGELEHLSIYLDGEDVTHTVDKRFGLDIYEAVREYACTHYEPAKERHFHVDYDDADD
jgi:hypothetical protein